MPGWLRLFQIGGSAEFDPYTTGEGFGYSKHSHRLPCHHLADGRSGAPSPGWLVVPHSLEIGGGGLCCAELF